MTRRTVFLARLIGMYFLLIALTFSAHKQQTLIAFDAIVHSQDIVLVTGIVALAVGLALVIGHNRWSGGAPAIIVTIVGWILLIRSVLVLLLPPDVVGLVYDMLGIDRYFSVYMVVIGVIGLYLIWSSFRGAKATTEIGADEPARLEAR